MKGSFWLFSAIFSFFFVSCEGDTAKSKPQITGYWSVEKAFRDSRATSLLNDVFFRFGADGKMFTNLPNTSIDPAPFEMNEGSLVQKTEPPILYNILEITDSTLVLTFKVQNTPFEFHLKKTHPPQPSELLPNNQIDSL